MEWESKTDKKSNKHRFQEKSDQQIEVIISKKNKDNTHKATKLWMTCFTEYLIEKDYPGPDDIDTLDLPSILEHFSSAVCKKPSNADVSSESESEQENNSPTTNTDASVLPAQKKKKNYKNTSMKAIRAAIARYYREKRSIDIMSNEAFLRANSVFTGILQVNKEQGLGNIQWKKEVSNFDLNILMNYFKASMAGPPSPNKLQDIIIFYILYFMCHTGRENLRFMTKETFQISIDPEDGRKYIYKAVDEADKNHTYNDTTMSNDGWIYEIQGDITYKCRASTRRLLDKLRVVRLITRNPLVTSDLRVIRRVTRSHLVTSTPIFYCPEVLCIIDYFCMNPERPLILDIRGSGFQNPSRRTKRVSFKSHRSDTT